MKKIDWAKWSSIAEILSAIAIVATLLYLAVQTNELRVQTEQNNQFLAEQNSYNVLQNQIGSVEFVVANEEIARLLYGDTDLDRLRRLALVRSNLYRWQWEYSRLTDGVISELPVEAYRNSAERMRLADVWTDVRGDMQPTFSEWVEEQILNR